MKYRHVLMLILLTCSPAATASVEHVYFHVLANESENLGSEDIKVPKVYVLNKDGDVIFEGAATSKQPYRPIADAVNNESTLAGVRKPGLMKLVKDHGLTFPRDLTKATIVTLEVGESIGVCLSCTPYYPDMLEYMDKNVPSVRWVHLVFERNDYTGK